MAVLPEPRELSATELAITDALQEAGYTAMRCLDAWTCFAKDGRTVYIWWDGVGEIDHVDGLTAAEILLVLAPSQGAGDAT